VGFVRPEKSTEIKNGQEKNKKIDAEDGDGIEFDYQVFLEGVEGDVASVALFANQDSCELRS
jgi:hypothetical protein